MEEPGIKRQREAEDNSLYSFYEYHLSHAQNPREKEKGKRWTPDQDDALRKAIEEFGQRNWKAIASRVHGRDHAQCLQRWSKVLKPGLVKGHWSFEEDSTLEQRVLQGCRSWGELATHIPGRTAKQCRERWRNHLDPSINKSPLSTEEDLVIQRGFAEMGNRWTQIAELLPGRTEDAVKLRWKALNPNEKVKAKPGRPKMMPGMTANKQLSTAPLSPDGIAALLMNPIPEISSNDNGFIRMLDSVNGASVTLLSMRLPQHEKAKANSSVPQEVLPSQSYEPIVEPRSDDVKAEYELRDAVILKELLRSHSNSLLSFGSACGLSSMTDILPEDLLASGELDEMFRATVSISKEREEEGRSSNALIDSLNSACKTPGSLQRAVQILDYGDKHLMHELIDNWRAQKAIGEDATIHEDDCTAHLPVEPNAYAQHDNCVMSSGRKSAHSLHFKESRSLSRQNSNGILHELGNISNDIGDLLHSDLMRPIRKGKMYV